MKIHIPIHIHTHPYPICIPAVHIISFRDYIMSVNITQLNTYLYKLKLLLDAVTNQRKHLPRPQLAQKFEFSDTTVPQLKQYISTGPLYGKSAPTRALGNWSQATWPASSWCWGSWLGNLRSTTKETTTTSIDRERTGTRTSFSVGQMKVKKRSACTTTTN